MNFSLLIVLCAFTRHFDCSTALEKGPSLLTQRRQKMEICMLKKPIFHFSPPDHCFLSRATFPASPRRLLAEQS